MDYTQNDMVACNTNIAKYSDNLDFKMSVTTSSSELNFSGTNTWDAVMNRWWIYKHRRPYDYHGDISWIMNIYHCLMV